MQLRIVSAIVLLVVVAIGCVGVRAAPIVGQGTWENTLQARDINNDNEVDAYYDSDLNITWLADWDVNGPMSWNDSVDWADDLSVFGVTGWRLPITTDSFNDGCTSAGGYGAPDCGYNPDPSTSELAHLFFITLGNKSSCTPGDGDCDPPQSGWGLTNTANFRNMNPYFYWSGTEYAPVSGSAWLFDANVGSQGSGDFPSTIYAVAVHPGDVVLASEVPLPGSLGLLGAALSVLGMMRWRNFGRSTSYLFNSL
jgi:hypothetical protein